MESQTNSNAEMKRMVILASGIVFLTGLLVLVLGLVHAPIGKGVLVGVLIVVAVGLFSAYNDRLLPAQIITSTVTFLALTYFLIEGEGVHDASITGYSATVIVAGLLLGQTGVLIFGFLSTFVLAVLAYVEFAGVFPTPYTGLFDSIDFNTVWILHLALSVFVFVLIRYLSSLAEKAKENERVLFDANQELSLLRDSLQKRVESRTLTLEKQNQKLQASSLVAREMLNTKEAGKLLDSSAKLITEEFGYDHVGIFLLNDRKEYAVLQAASSDGGKEMLRRGHQLKVGSEGVVGAAVAEKRPRIALDVGEDAVFFNNPNLPETRSEMALPLIVQGETVGVLDIQSNESQAFTQGDVAVLQTLANQLALSLQNARLIEETETNIMQLELIAEAQTEQAWRTYLRDDYYGFLYTPLGVKKVMSKQFLKKKAEGEQTEVPILLRGNAIGHFSFRRETQEWTNKEKDLIAEVAEQVGLAIENVRLVNQTRAQAIQEQLASEFTTKLRETLDMDTVVKTAITEVQKTFNLEEVEIRLNNPGES